MLLQGTLAQLDSPNPVMYIDLPQGRLKLFGTLVFPHQKYMVLKLGAGEALAEDLFESLVSSGGQRELTPHCMGTVESRVISSTLIIYLSLPILIILKHQSCLSRFLCSQLGWVLCLNPSSLFVNSMLTIIFKA